MQIQRSYYSDTIPEFLQKPEEQVTGTMVLRSEFSDMQTQRKKCVRPRSDT